MVLEPEVTKFQNSLFWVLAESNRWQDGAIVANNPTIIALREAQLIWPDTQVDCLVSVGCGNVPTKVCTLLSFHVHEDHVFFLIIYHVKM